MTEEDVMKLFYPYSSNPSLIKYLQESELKRRWTADQELKERTQQQQRYSTLQQNYQINQTLEMRARPNPFVMPFQNGL